MGVRSFAECHVQLGIYTSKKSWAAITCDAKIHGDLPLWYPRYERVPNPSFSDFVPFGGMCWPSPIWIVLLLFVRMRAYA